MNFNKEYTPPLTYEESISYIDNYYQRQATAFNVNVVCIVSVLSNGEFNYVEKTMEIININPEKQYSDGGTSFPTKTIKIDKKKQIIIKTNYFHLSVCK